LLLITPGTATGHSVARTVQTVGVDVAAPGSTGTSKDGDRPRYSNYLGRHRLFTVTLDGRLNKVFKVGVALFALGVVIIGIAAIFFWGSPNFSFMAACAAALFSVATLNFALSVRTNRRVEV
jgi:hypothetical protein